MMIPKLLTTLALAATLPIGSAAATDTNGKYGEADPTAEHSRASSSSPARTFDGVVYSTTPQGPLTLNIFLSDHAMREAAPVLVYFHGGAWARGAPPQTADGFKGFLKEGISVVTVQYRLAGQAMAPAAVQDARCALSWLATNAAKLHIDTDRMIVTGTSAGGHLALWAVTGALTFYFFTQRIWVGFAVMFAGLALGATTLTSAPPSRSDVASSDHG